MALPAYKHLYTIHCLNPRSSNNQIVYTGDSKWWHTSCRSGSWSANDEEIYSLRLFDVLQIYYSDVYDDDDGDDDDDDDGDDDADSADGDENYDV